MMIIDRSRSSMPVSPSRSLTVVPGAMFNPPIRRALLEDSLALGLFRRFVDRRLGISPHRGLLHVPPSDGGSTTLTGCHHTSPFSCVSSTLTVGSGCDSHLLEQSHPLAQSALGQVV